MKMKSNKKLVTTLALAGLMLASPLTAFAASFKDVDSSFWAYKHITKLSESGVVKGYPDGNFRPSKSVSYLEILELLKGVMNPNATEIRLALENKGSIADMYGVDKWAKEAVCLALARGVITEGELKEAYNLGQVTSRPDSGQYPSRTKIAVLYARALGLEPRKDHSILKYKDLASLGNIADPKYGNIPVADYLSALVYAGIYHPEGDGGNFQGARDIVRSEMAKITDLSYDYANKRQSIEGKIILISEINGKKTIVVEEKAEKSIAINLDSDTLIKQGEKIGQVSDLKEGQRVKVLAVKGQGERNDRALNVEIINTEMTGTGRILVRDKDKVNIAYTEAKIEDYTKTFVAEKTQDFTLAKDVKITSYGREVNLNSIGSKDFVQFVAENNVISQIKVIPEKASIDGRIEKLVTDGYWGSQVATLSLKLADGKNYDFVVKDSKILSNLLQEAGKSNHHQFSLKYNEVVGIDDTYRLDTNQGIFVGTRDQGGKKYVVISDLQSEKWYELAENVVFTDKSESNNFATIKGKENVFNGLMSYPKSLITLKIDNNLITMIQIEKKDIKDFDKLGMIKKIENSGTAFETIYVDLDLESNLKMEVKFNPIGGHSYRVGDKLKIKGFYNKQEVVFFYIDK